MIIFVTAISGSGRLDYIKRVQKLAGDRLEIRDIGSMMFEKSRQLGIEIPEGKILDLDPFALNYLRAAIFEKLLKEKRSFEGYGEEDRDLIISTHTCFRWKKHLLPGFNFYYLNQLKPDVYVTIIDNVHYIKARLESNPHWRGRLTLKDILIWRDEEVFISEMLAQYQQKPHYIIAHSDPPDVLYNIIYNVEKKRRRGEKPAIKAYLSYPITCVKGRDEFMREKNEVKEKLKKSGIVVFDPISVEEMDIVGEAEAAAREGREEIVFEVEGKEYSVSVREVEDAKEDIIDQVVVRDYKLINQSDIIIVYYPVEYLSAGVLSEINYGFTHNKEVYAIFPHSVSPFLRYYTTKIFRSPEELIEYFREREMI